MSAAVGVRAFFGTIGRALRGPDPDTAGREMREQRMTELSQVARGATAFDELVKSAGWAAFMELANARRAKMMQQLVNAKPEEFQAVQAGLKAFEEALNLVPNAVAQGRAAREELERISEEEE